MILKTGRGRRNMKTGLHRDTSDAFYTQPSIAASCLQQAVRHAEPADGDVFLEPSAGAGAFSPPLQQKYTRVYSFDTNPQSTGVRRLDFLTLPQTPFYQEILSHQKPVHVLGNPPFGRQSKTARAFIRLCAGFATSISFILPKSFKKPSFQKAFPLRFHLLHQTDLPTHSFTMDGRPYDVPCVFQVWKRMPHDRPTPPLLEPVGFVFCKKGGHPDLAIRRVGVYAGRLVEDHLSGLSEQSHYFIRLTGMDRAAFRSRFQAIGFDTENTVGPRSISQQEILQGFS
jgi:hypothetical protein